MTWLYVLSGLVAAGLLVYLIAALLYPEDFS
jgi:K+-transporting ATPase KdpF subunit